MSAYRGKGNGVKAVAVAALLAVLVGCVPPLYEFGWALEFDIPDLGVRTVQDAVAWTARNVHYAWDDGEYWQHPGQTYDRRAGDCEDYTILAMYLVYRDVGVEPVMMTGRHNSGSFGHAWMRVDGIDYSPQIGGPAPYLSIYYSERRRAIPYGEAIWRATMTHRSVLADG